MATISAISAFSGNNYGVIDKTHSDIYKLYPLIATRTDNTQSARVVLGTTYFFNTSGYNTYRVQLSDYAPGETVSDSHASIWCYPMYRAATFTLDSTQLNHAKLFSSFTTAKYKYTGSTEESEYGSFGPIMCKYARFMHLSGNVAYDYQRNYSSDSSISLLAQIDISKLPTAFDDQIFAVAFEQIHTAWLSSYVESNLDESVARHIVYNPAIVGKRFNTPDEFHSPISVVISKPANSSIITLSHTSYITSWLVRRVGRFVFDFEIML